MSDLSGDGGMSGAELAKVVKMLAQRWFVMRDVHSAVGTMLLQPRWATSVMRGPMTRGEIRRALGKAETESVARIVPVPPDDENTHRE